MQYIWVFDAKKKNNNNSKRESTKSVLDGLTSG